MDRAKELIPDFSKEKFKMAIDNSSAQELADLANAFGSEFDTEKYNKNK